MIDCNSKLYRRLHREHGPHRYCYGGSSSSSTSSADQTQETNNIDARVAGGQNSQNLSSVNSTVSLTLSDSGAIGQSFGFSRDVLNGALEYVKNADDSSKRLVAGALDTVNESLDKIAAAYSEAKAGEQKILVAAGLMLVSIVAVRALKKG